MKVLIMPINIASMPAITADALAKIEGVEAICLNTVQHKYMSPSNNTIEIKTYRRRRPYKYFREIIRKYYYYIKLIIWADVIHYVWDSLTPNNFDLKLIKWLKKPGIIEWVGSDIRCPEKSFPVNKYIQDIFYNGYEYAHVENNEKSKKLQQKFKKIKFVPALSPELQLYLWHEYFPTVYPLFHRISVKNFTPRYPDVNNKRPLIVHSPSATIAKGSKHIINAIAEIQKDFDVEFIMLHDLPHKEVLKVMERADIFIDAIILGGYGMAAMEAMSMGKPTLCYLMPGVFEKGIPNDCPIVNTDPENLQDNLRMLLENSQLRYELGIKGRAFAEKYHDVDVWAEYLVKVYQEVINNYKASKFIPSKVKMDF